MSLDAIGERAGKHPSTVSYWLKKHGLEGGRARNGMRRKAVRRTSASCESFGRRGI